ncbi:MAG: HAD-IB family phosphatase [Pseudomonadales bacterium]|jgi:phosphatidylglycerophosphatase C|nr:HAD-IB family phosphatase [Pseudomonadales bacterium]
MPSSRFALFDLDGTLTRRDSFTAWTLGLLRWQPLRVLRVPLLLGAVLRYARQRDRGALKGAVLRWLFGGLPRKLIDDWSQQFARELVARGMFADGLTALRAHLLADEEVVLLSASPDVYVPFIGEALGVKRVICTQVRWNGEHLDGRLASPNRRGAEKARVLTALRAERSGQSVIGYGNSPADLDHLRLCEEAVYVNAPPALAHQLKQDVPQMRHVRWK